ncbi:unnamed protein product, partial [Staurois parvus]
MSSLTPLSLPSVLPRKYANMWPHGKKPSSVRPHVCVKSTRRGLK